MIPFSGNIDETRASRNKFIKQFIQPIKEELDKLKVPYEIKGRPKSIYSIWNKMRKQNIPFDEVYDCLRFGLSWTLR
jgi:guanosine-3',5'-bis(diphosphate) 3'-pyrophosphohydrolase